MITLDQSSKMVYSKHGWSDEDISYVEENCTILKYGDGWVISGAVAEDGVLWMYPASQNNIFPKSQWQSIKEYILEYDNVVIPMNKNTDKVDRAAKRYNGYLLDNMYMFGNELKGLQFYEGEKRWLGLKEL